MRTFSITPKLSSACAALFVFVAAPLSFAAEAQEKLQDSLEETSAEIARTGNQLQKAVMALTALAHQEDGDLRPGFSAFREAITDTQESAKVTSNRARMLRDNMNAYFTAWNSEIGTINNPSIKKLRKSAPPPSSSVTRNSPRGWAAPATASRLCSAT